MQPMLATPGALPVGPEWMFEVRWAGLRVLVDVLDGRPRLVDGAGADVTGAFPELVTAVRLAPDVLLDGVLVALADGVPSPAVLARRLRTPRKRARARASVPPPPVTFMVFDVLRLYGVPLLDRPLEERRATLERLQVDPAPDARLARSPSYSDGAALLAATTQRGLAGLVAKRRTSPYRPGVRSPDWVSVTTHSQHDVTTQSQHDAVTTH